MWTCSPSRRSRSEPRRRSIARRASAGARPNLESSWPVATAACVSGRHPGDDAHEHGLLAAHEPLEAIDVVEVVDHHRSDAGVDGALEVLVGLRVAVQVDALRVDARRDRDARARRPPATSQPSPSSATARRTGGTGEAPWRRRWPRESFQRAASSSRYSRARARSAPSSTT